MAAAVALLSIAPTAWADFDVVTLDSSRIGTFNGVDVNFTTSAAFQTAREALLDLANFGPGGVVPHAANLVAVSEFNAATLAGAELILIPFQLTGTPFTAAEQAAVASFLNAGGGLLAFTNVTPFEPFYTSQFPGLGPGGGFLGPRDSVVGNPASPLVNGAFGALATGTLVPMGFSANFSATSPGASGAGLLDSANPLLPVGLSFEFGDGRVALFSDEEIFADDDVNVPGVITGRLPSGVDSANLTVFLNSVNFARAIPEPSSVVLMGLGTLAVGFFARGRIAAGRRA